MAIRVELILFSGIRNPAWMLNTDDLPLFKTALGQLQGGAFDLNVSVEFAPPASGYRGFDVRGSGEDSEISLHVWSARALSGTSLFWDTAGLLESWLYGTAPLAIKMSLGLTFAQLSSTPAATHTIAGIASGPAEIVCPDAPTYPVSPSFWDTHRKSNNCYNYANDVVFGQSMTGAMPGGLTTWADAAEMRRAAEYDNLVWDGMRPPTVCTGDANTHLLAICLRSKMGIYQDFHCLRLDDSGVWSQKDGPDPVDQVDGSRLVIRNIRSAVFNQPMTLVGFFWSPPARSLRP
ncbi:MAG: hypothetical protein Q8T13_02530 [Acidobacteriota bacterium]|nr:hypothetical protein [Acidobacteriota bacterium]